MIEIIKKLLGQKIVRYITYGIIFLIAFKLIAIIVGIFIPPLGFVLNNVFYFVILAAIAYVWFKSRKKKVAETYIAGNDGSIKVSELKKVLPKDKPFLPDVNDKSEAEMKELLSRKKNDQVKDLFNMIDEEIKKKAL